MHVLVKPNLDKAKIYIQAVLLSLQDQFHRQL